MAGPAMREEGSPPHVPVLLDEVMAALALSPGDHLVDATFGGGGYSRRALEAGARVTAFDRDPAAIAAGRALASAHPGSLTLVEAPFADMGSHVAAGTADAVAFDLGVSSMQLDQPDYGMSFRHDAPLDMRMGRTGMTAADFLNTADEAEIADVLFRLGEEPAARRIARAIVRARPVARTGELHAIVMKALGRPKGQRRDPATRTFQALRIHVNDELGQLEAGLAAAETALKPGGRLAVVSFHSLEDRIVKTFLGKRSGPRAQPSRHLPLPPAEAGERAFDKPARPVRPSEAEVAANPRARSAILRAATRADGRAEAVGARGGEVR